MRTQLLSWADAVAEDREALKQFRCTSEPVRGPTSVWKRTYSRPYERVAEKLIHGLNPAKAARRPQRIWLGRDDEGIAAVLAWSWLPDQSIMVDVAALARRIRNLGAHPTQEMVDTSQAQAMGEAVTRGLAALDVGAVIHKNNLASRYFAGRFGMTVIREEDDEHLLYGITLDAAAE